MTPDPFRPARPDPGASVTFRWRKWDDSPHWVHDCLFLGSDRWGDWVGQPAGYRSVRPGRELTAAGPNVTLIPPDGQYTLTVNAVPPALYRIYIDIAWDVGWSDVDATVLEGIDMDLDVVLAVDGRGLWIDDRDEWDEHRMQWGYPLDVVTTLEELAVDLERRVAASDPPFDDPTADHWFARLRTLEK